MFMKDCTALKNAMINAKVEDGFLCLSATDEFPASWGEAGNTIPSKLLFRDFHNEVRLILQHLRENRKLIPNRGAVFLGMTDTGKSWTAMSVLVDELKRAETTGHSVVFMDPSGARAFVFSKSRSVVIQDIYRPSVAAMPELEQEDTVLIYDAAPENREPLLRYPCDYVIFSSPSAGNFKHVARACGLYQFVCPSWSLQELKRLAQGYGDRGSAAKVQQWFQQYGGHPSAVVVNPQPGSGAQERDVFFHLFTGRNVFLSMNLDRPCTDWPSFLLKAKYRSEAVAQSPQEAFQKYLQWHVAWDYASDRARDLVHAEHDRVDDATRSAFQSWLLLCDSKARPLIAQLFEHHTRILSTGDPDHTVAVDCKQLATSIEGSGSVRKKVEGVLGEGRRGLSWQFPHIKDIQQAPIAAEGGDYQLSALQKLTDPTVLYRLPPGFPLVDYFSPPGNCFSLGVEAFQPLLSLQQATDLCRSGVPAPHQVNFVHVALAHRYDSVQRWRLDTGSGGSGAPGSIKSPSASAVRALARMAHFCVRFKKG